MTFCTIEKNQAKKKNWGKSSGENLVVSEKELNKFHLINNYSKYTPWNIWLVLMHFQILAMIGSLILVFLAHLIMLVFEAEHIRNIESGGVPQYVGDRGLLKFCQGKWIIWWEGRKRCSRFCVLHWQAIRWNRKLERRIFIILFRLFE